MSTPIISFDPDAHTLYVRLTDEPVERSVELSPTVYMDIDRDGQPIGLEILQASGILPDAFKNATGSAPLDELILNTR